MGARTLTVVLSPEELTDAIQRALEPVRVELERLRGERVPQLVPLEEAARRLNKSRRTLERWAKEKRIEEEWVGGVRMVRLPPGLAQR